MVHAYGKRSGYNHNVFINCPFDEEYKPLFRAQLFVIQSAGLTPRCALEAYDGGELRLGKIVRIIRSSRLGIHDISRTELDRVNRLPRFNMPFELGLDLGARFFGLPRNRRKVQLVLNGDRFAHQKYLSDLAGQDISAHGNDPERVVGLVRDWLRFNCPDRAIPGPLSMIERWRRFETDFPSLCRDLGDQPEKITFIDVTKLIYLWQAYTP